MGFSKTLLLILFTLIFTTCHAANSNLFREYIGAESDTIKMSNVPINSKVEFHFILAFAIDYTNDDNKNPSPTNGKFNIFLESKHLNPNTIASIKRHHSNVRIALSLGGYSIGKNKAFFAPKTISSWVKNSVTSLTTLIKKYHIDGIDIDYENFHSDDPRAFVECIGQLITSLKKRGAISFASIAPYEDQGPVQGHYQALWRHYGDVIDYVNFQFYAYDKLSVSEFVSRFNEQRDSSYPGGQVLASFISNGGEGLGPGDGFLEACRELKSEGKLGGIFVWCADESAARGFEYEKKAQTLLATV